MRRYLRGATARLLQSDPPAAARYHCDARELGALRDRFLQLHPDAATAHFLAQGLERAFLQELAAELAAALLQLCLTAADANLLCGLGEMFVVSTAQARQLLDASGSWTRGHLFDCGAGGGGVTAQLEPLAERVVCSEVSNSAAARLRQRGWQCEVGEIPTQPDGAFDVVTCFNVLCRAARPLSLLRRLRDMLRPDGVMLLAIVLPFRPAVLGRARSSSSPREHFPQELIAAPTFEEGVLMFSNLVLRPMGLVVSVVSRVPYYSRGTHGEYYVLDDALFACRLKPERTA
ncbi:hypothetical protein AB1Y20_001504 [Prymnesium parvum]|uniref:Methyltransferase-like protein 9 n=1 Tax=Prymnesium parvum TaxID=97485 RepID=A0AB34KDI5_PRYPA